jgi:hypothetical protein
MPIVEVSEAGLRNLERLAGIWKQSKEAALDEVLETMSRAFEPPSRLRLGPAPPAPPPAE